MKLGRQIAALFGATCLTALGAAEPVWAQTFYADGTLTPTSTVSASASPGSFNGQGWPDAKGNEWFSQPAGPNSAESLFFTTLNSGSGELYRTATDASGVGQQIQQDYYNYSTANGETTYSDCHYVIASGLKYTVGINGGTLTAYAGSTALGAPTSGSTTISGTATGVGYTLSLGCIQTNSTTTTLTAQLTNTSTGAVLGTTVWTDTTAALQNVVSTVGVHGYTTNSGYKDPIYTIRTYTTATPPAATALTLSGPTAGYTGQASSNFTLSSNGTLSSSTTASLTDDQGCTTACFTPSSPTLAAGSYTTVNFTYTPQVAGSRTITAAASGLTSATAPYAATAVVTISPYSAAFKFSPYNWKGYGSTARVAGLSYPQTWNIGANFTVVWTASSSATATLLLPTKSNTLAISCLLDGVLGGNGVAVTGNLTLASLGFSTISAGSHTLRCYVRNSNNTSVWNQGAGAGTTLQVQGLQVDAGSSAGTAPGPAAYGDVLIHGDSVPEGILAAGSTDDFFDSHMYLAMNALEARGYDVGTAIMTGTGFIATLNGVPGDYPVSGGVYGGATSGRWNQVDQGVSLLDANGQISAYGFTGTSPALIVYETLGNDERVSANVSDLQTSVRSEALALRAAAPNAKIIFFTPLQMEYPNAGYTLTQDTTYTTPFHAGLASANAAGANVLDVDLGAALAKQIYSNAFYGSVANQPHINLQGHATEAPYFMNAITQALAPAATATSKRGVGSPISTPFSH